MVITAILLISSVSAFREVRCDEGRFNSDICRDFELQDEFNDLESYVDALASDSECRDRFLRNHIDWTKADLERQLGIMEDELKDYSDINDRRVVAVSQQGDEDVKDYSDVNDRRVVTVSKSDDEDLYNSIIINDEKWTKGDGDGIALSSVARHLTGIETFFREHETFLGYLFGIFADKAELENANQRIDMLEARLNRLEETTMSTAAYNINSIECEAMLIRANRLGAQIEFGDGWSAFPGDQHCIKLTFIR